MCQRAPPAALQSRLSASLERANAPAWAAARGGSAPPAFGTRTTPLDFGGDPSGRLDSLAALNACVQFCVNYSQAIDFLGHFPGDASFGNGKYIANAGGCEIDLAGGEYLLSAPLQIPQFLANLRLGHGSLVADDAPGVFPADSFLVVVGVKGSCQYPQGSCNADLGFPELFMDGRHVASAIQINDVMGTTVGPGFYALNFTAYGIQINAGHEVLVDRSWLGETNFDYRFSPTDLPQSVAIETNGNDHYILNTVVFSSKVGLAINGAANYVSGVHVWFPWNQALAFVDDGVMAFHITSDQNRFANCYIDGSRAVFEGRGLTQNVWHQGFECCAGVAGVAHGIELRGAGAGSGLVIQNNIFRGGNVFFTNTTAAPPKVSGTLINQNSFSSDGAGSRATASLTQTAATQWQFNFCAQLVFPVIASSTVSVSAASGFPVAVARPPVGCTILVETSEPVTGTVTVSVDSSELSDGFI
jgi:hypothetical protein